ncbi:MAG: N-formylglutamate amidohydrolase [Rhodospirillales bacterium]|jgi:N-formylglutamate deformylase|nr:N-formylglutamate amidohydrolase [Rhodospirillales bacterium]
MHPLDPALISLTRPSPQTLPLVVAVPHAGRDYGKRFTRGALPESAQLRRIEDAFADELAAQAPGKGAPLLVARFPRIWLDVNRDWRELDPLLVLGDDLPADSLSATNNVRNGLGVVPRLLSGGIPIHQSPLPHAEIQSRLDAAWHPYHATLSCLIEETRAQFGHCLLIDCHSMPTGREAEPLDIVLGDGFGTTAGNDVMTRAEEYFASLGYKVSRNQPYAGGYTTRHYGQPSDNIHALQIEIRRSLYMDEHSFERISGLNTLAGQLGALFALLGHSLMK